MNAVIRGGAICSYSPPARLHLQLKVPPFAVTSGPVACSSTTAAPHEFFGHVGDWLTAVFFSLCCGLYVDTEVMVPTYRNRPSPMLKITISFEANLQ
jgi:hypothetical protein